VRRNAWVCMAKVEEVVLLDYPLGYHYQSSSGSEDDAASGPHLHIFVMGRW
jgi:hypothetical protein